MLTANRHFVILAIRRNVIQPIRQLFIINKSSDIFRLPFAHTPYLKQTNKTIAEACQVYFIFVATIQPFHTLRNVQEQSKQSIGENTSIYFVSDHIFVQQPTNPTFSALERLEWCMYNTYSDLTCPTLQSPVAVNSICVAPSNGGWYRCQVRYEKKNGF